MNGEAVAEAYHATILPTVYLIGADGTILHVGTGTTAETVAALIHQHLKGPH